MVTDRKAERQRKGVRGGREERVRDVELEMDRRECGCGIKSTIPRVPPVPFTTPS